MILRKLLIVFISIFSSISHAVNIEEVKLKNQPINSQCVDFKKMKQAELKLSFEFFESLQAHFKMNPLTSVEKAKGIEFSPRAIGIDGKLLVVVFNVRSALAAQPGYLLRSEYREALYKRLKPWHLSLQKKNFKNTDLVVRFLDECHVPDRCDDYQYGHGLLGQLVRFGCK